MVGADETTELWRPPIKFTSSSMQKRYLWLTDVSFYSTVPEIKAHPHPPTHTAFNFFLSIFPLLGGRAAAGLVRVGPMLP